MYSPEQYEFHQPEEVTIYKVQDLQVALEKAMENISELQSNLQFMIKYNQQLKQEHLNQQKKTTKTIQQLQSSLAKKDKEISSFKEKHNQYELLLSDTKTALDQCKETILEKEEQLERFQRIIHQQKTTISSLQDEVLNSKYNEVSLQSNQTCFLQVQDLEKQVEQLQYQNKRLMASVEKQVKKTVQLQKENIQFKNWLGDMVGVRKVVNGCEKILMNQIARKLNVSL